MEFVFPPEIQEGIESGQYEVVISKAGELLSIARDIDTGKFVSHAVGVLQESSSLVSPFLSMPNALDFSNLIGVIGNGMGGVLTEGIGVIADGALSLQMHLGFQKTYQMLSQVQHMVGVLQATTSVIGVISLAGVALSAVNLHQTLKLRKDVEELKYQVKDGFINVLEQINGIPDAVQFNHHRTILIMAYGEFLQALKLMKLALNTENEQTRHSTLSNAQLHLSYAYNAYTKPELFADTTAAAQLRRLECAWMIEQTQAMNFQLMNAPESASHCLQELQKQMQSESLQIIDTCKCEEELAFIYPELTRIHTQDVPILNSWENHIDWVRQLSPSEKKEMLALGSESEPSEDIEVEELNLEEEPPEITQYKQLELESHYESLRDQLRYTVNRNVRQQHLNYIKEKAQSANLKGIVPVNLEKVSDLTISNIYNYLKTR